MKILFLDDMKERHDAFERHLTLEDSPHDVTYVWSAEGAMNALEAEKFDVAFLDHDLASIHYDEFSSGQRPVTSEPDGTSVAEFIAKLPREKQPDWVVIHTWNYAGANRMSDVLRDVSFTQVPDGIKVRKWQFNPKQHPLRAAGIETSG